METIDAYERAAAWTRDRFDAVRGNQMDDPTPCRDWTVRQVMSHVIDGNLRFSAGLTGASERPGPDQAVIGGNAGASYRTSVEGVLAARQTEGAAERSLPLSIGELPAGFVLAIMMTEQLLHGWDVADATGQDTALDPALVAVADGILRTPVESGQAGSAYDPPIEVSEDADPQARLLALVGRRP